MELLTALLSACSESPPAQREGIRKAQPPECWHQPGRDSERKKSLCPLSVRTDPGRCPLKDESPDRQTGALGDTLMLMPALVHMKEKAEIVFVGRYPALDFLGPYVHRSLHFEGPGWHSLFVENPAPSQWPSLPSVDLAVVFLADLGSKLI